MNKHECVEIGMFIDVDAVGNPGGLCKTPGLSTYGRVQEISHIYKPQYIFAEVYADVYFCRYILTVLMGLIGSCGPVSAAVAVPLDGHGGR